MRRLLFFALVTGMAAFRLAAQAAVDLTIQASDLFVEYNSGRSIGTAKDGFNVYVRKKPGVQSVMFVETTKDPEGKADNFAYRATEYNSLNGDEIRYLNGERLTSPYARNSLISSTVTTHPRLGECFLIYVPRTLQYGYPWTRSGTVTVARGTFVNIRTFTLKYGDYEGEFYDNPFMFDFSDAPAPAGTPAAILTDDYNPVAAESFAQIAKDGNGLLTYSKGPASLDDELIELVDTIYPRTKVDLLFAIDTTGSMADDLEALQTKWVPRFRKQIEGFDSMRLGLLFYRDYTDDYNYKNLPVKLFGFTEDENVFVRNLHSPVIKGGEGGDVPEAVYEALYAGIAYFDWRDDAERRIVLIGDAEPHPKPRGPKKITGELVTQLAAEKGIKIHTLLIPTPKKKTE